MNNREQCNAVLMPEGWEEAEEGGENNRWVWKEGVKLCKLRSGEEFSLLALTFSHVFYFFLIFNVSVMQLRAIAAWKFIESSTEKKKKVWWRRWRRVALAPTRNFFTSLSCFVSTSYLVQIESTSVGSKAWCCISGTSQVISCLAIRETLACLAQSQAATSRSQMFEAFAS